MPCHPRFGGSEIKDTALYEVSSVPLAEESARTRYMPHGAGIVCYGGDSTCLRNCSAVV